MPQTTRRNFLKSSLAFAGTAFAINGSANKILGANDTIRMAVTGIHGRGGSHISEFQKMKGVEIVCLVDPDARTFPDRVKQVEDLGGKTPKTYQDIRKALKAEDLDCLSIANTNHWHSLSAIWGCQAGLDVYVEKPCSHNIHEGRILVETARKYNRIVQHGTQSRSERGWHQVAEIVKKGTYGKLLISRGLCYKRRDSIGFKPNGTPPPELNFDLWLGPAPEQPYNTNLVHYNWHWFWDFGSGDIGNQGVHQMDIARWMIPGAKLPKSVISLGGRFGYKDQAQTPNTMISVFDYGETQIIFEVRGLPTPKYYGSDRQVMHFEEGVVVNNKFYPNGSQQPQDLPRMDVELGPGGNHFSNFIAAVRSRKRSDLNAEILEGHLSSAHCHLANISYRLGEEVPFNPRTKVFGDNKEAYETLGRMEEHLKENGVNLAETTCRVGPKLIVDEENEKIVNNEKANKLLTRDYRKPFVVPDKVV